MQRKRSAAERWDLNPEEIEKLRTMLRGHSWKLIEGVLKEIEAGAMGELKSSVEQVKIFRAQGEMRAIATLRGRIKAMIHEEDEDDRR